MKVCHYKIGDTPVLAKSLGQVAQTSCPPGMHSHIDYHGGKCHRVDQMHVQAGQEQQTLAGGSDKAKVAAYIRRELLTLSYVMTKDKNMTQAYIYINEVMRNPEDVNAWGKFYNTLKLCVQKNPKLPRLVNLYAVTRSVKV